MLSRRIAVNSFFLLVGSYLVGAHVLAFMGISLPVVQVGGGLIVISTGWAMLKRREEEERNEARSGVRTEDVFRQAFYPLTLPLTVGPGSIAVAITLGANGPHNNASKLLTVVAALVGCLLVAIIILICYGFAERLARAIGSTGMSVIMRLSSFLLVCIGVQILWNGASSLIASLPAR
jgi:multiple antibiotic resistance protein